MVSSELGMVQSIGARKPKVWGSNFFSLSRARDKTKNIFLYPRVEPANSKPVNSKPNSNKLLFPLDFASFFESFTISYLEVGQLELILLFKA